MNCTYQDETGVQKPVIMGCYGIGVGRLLACLCEEYNDEKGLCLPITVAPYQVHLVSLLKDNAVGEKIYKELVDAGKLPPVFFGSFLRYAHWDWQRIP